MSYYPVNITMRGFKEATHRKVVIGWNTVPYTPNGTIPDMPRSILMNSLGKSRQPGPHTLPQSLTQPHKMEGGASPK